MKGKKGQGMERKNKRVGEGKRKEKEKVRRRNKSRKGCWEEDGECVILKKKKHFLFHYNLYHECKRKYFNNRFKTTSRKYADVRPKL